MYMNRMTQKLRWPMLLAGLALSAMVSVANAAENLVRLSNGEAITEQDLSVYLDRRLDLRAVARNISGTETVLREMALARALALEGERLGEPRSEDRKDERFDDVYALTIFKKLSKVCEPPADAAAARKFFDEHPQAFRVPPMARLGRVMLPVSETVDGGPSMGWMFEQAQAISGGTRSFEDVAEKASSVYKLDPQGDLGWVTLTDDTTILRALASAAQGDLVGPVRDGDFGYLFLVMSKRESRQLAWSEVAVSVPTRAVNFCRHEASEQLRDDLFKKYGVELDQAAIKGLFDRKTKQ